MPSACRCRRSEWEAPLASSLSVSVEAAVLRDLWRASETPLAATESSGTRARQGPAAPLDPLPPAGLWNPTWGGFSGWYPGGTLDQFLGARPARDDAAVARVLAPSGLRPGQHLVYRLSHASPSGRKGTRAGKAILYIGSAVRGQVARRLRAHHTGTAGGSRALHQYLRRVNPRHIRVEIGWVPGQRPYGSGTPQDALNYNTLFLLEKILQRRYRPRFWNPQDRTFDEAQP